MVNADNYLHTTHRTVSWVNKCHAADELKLAVPFQRNPVWTTAQKSYLIDTILLGYPIPELYMQDTVSSSGKEEYVVVDGQQRLRACLDFVSGAYSLEGNDVTLRWRELKFDDLEPEEKQRIFAYKFVVRVLPALPDDELRKIFARLNRNVVALNSQELRNATYWGAFITTIHTLADEAMWSETGLFSANDYRRMLDHEFISELAIAYLHGAQNKKDKLDHYYQLYESAFERQDEVMANFRTISREIQQVIPNLRLTRWKKKSDFYSLFLYFAANVNDLPWSSDHRRFVGSGVITFGAAVDSLSRVEEEGWAEHDAEVVKYTKNVIRAASDRASRVARLEALTAYLAQSGVQRQLPGS